MPVQFPQVTVPQQQGTDLSSSYLQGRQAAQQQATAQQQLAQQQFGNQLRMQELGQKTQTHALDIEKRMMELGKLAQNKLDTNTYQVEAAAIGVPDTQEKQARLYNLQTQFAHLEGVTPNQKLLEGLLPQDKSPSPDKVADINRNLAYQTEHEAVLGEMRAAGGRLSDPFWRNRVNEVRSKYQISVLPQVTQTPLKQSDLSVLAKEIFNIPTDGSLTDESREWMKNQRAKGATKQSVSAARQAAFDVADVDQDGILNNEEAIVYRDLLKQSLLKAAASAKVVMPAGETAHAKKMAEINAKAWEVERENYRDASAQYVDLVGMITLAMEAPFETGFGSETRLDIARIFDAFFPGLGESIYANIGPAEAFRGYSNRLALALKKMMPGPLSDRDIIFMKEAAAGLGKSRMGNMLMLAMQGRVVARMMDRRDKAWYYIKNVSEKGQLDGGFEGWLHQQYDRTDPTKDLFGGLARTGDEVPIVVTPKDRAALPAFTIYRQEVDDGKGGKVMDVFLKT
jgi:hypothetical protein